MNDDDFAPIKKAITAAGLDRSPAEILASHNRWNWLRQPWMSFVCWRQKALWQEFFVGLGWNLEDPFWRRLLRKGLITSFIFWTGFILFSLGCLISRFVFQGGADAWGEVAFATAAMGVIGLFLGAFFSYEEGGLRLNKRHFRHYLYFPLMPFIRVIDYLYLPKVEPGKELLSVDAQVVIQRYRKGLAEVQNVFLGPQAPITKKINDLQKERDALRWRAAQAEVRLNEAKKEEDVDRTGVMTSLIACITEESTSIEQRLEGLRGLVAKTQGFFADYEQKISGLSSRLSDKQLIESIEMGHERRAQLLAEADAMINRYPEAIREQLLHLHQILADVSLPENVTDGHMQQYLTELEAAAEKVEQLSARPALPAPGETVH